MSAISEWSLATIAASGEEVREIFATAFVVPLTRRRASSAS